MAWTAPATATTGQQMTAAFWNAQVRDNFLETSAATVTTAGDIAFADAANSMGSRVGIGASNTHLVSNGSAPVWRGQGTDADTGTGTKAVGEGTSYTSLGTGASDWAFASEIEVTVTTGSVALVFWKANMANDTAGSKVFLSYSVSGATTVAASDDRAIQYESGAANDNAEFGGFDLATGLTGGSNVFTLEGRITGDTGTIQRPEIAVVAL